MNWFVACALPLAWGVDALFGEPPNRWHPVAWLGNLLGPCGRELCYWRPRWAFIGGALAWCAVAVALAAGAWWLQQALLGQPAWAAVLALALLLKPCFAWRLLHDEVAAVEAALQTEGLEAGRQRLARLVSRDVSALSETEVRESAIETLAENLNDSVIAPLGWFVLLGLPGAVVYRFANTADAMWGYRGNYEWAGKWAARADDVLSWWPARLSAWLLAPGLGPRGWWRLCGEAARTPSPNGGWPMGAMALRLGVRLSKPGVYELNPQGRAPDEHDLRLALRHARRAAWGMAGLATGFLLVQSAWS